MLSMFFWKKSIFEEHFNGPFEAVLLLTEAALKLALFVLTCFADRAPPLLGGLEDDDEKSEETPLQPYPEASASFVSKHTYWWYNPLARLGYSRTLKAEDIWDIQEHHKAKQLAAKFDRQWRIQVDKRGSDHKLPSVISVLIGTFGLTYLRACLFQLISLCMIFIGPQLLK